MTQWAEAHVLHVGGTPGFDLHYCMAPRALSGVNFGTIPEIDPSTASCTPQKEKEMRDEQLKSGGITRPQRYKLPAWLPPNHAL